MRIAKPTVPGTRLGMPVTAWPEPDRVAWTAAFAPLELLDDKPNGAVLRLPTRNALETCYARFLIYVKVSDPEALVLPLEARATRDRVRAYVNELLEQLSVLTVYGYAVRLKRALQLLCPNAEWSWMDPMLRKLNKRARRAGHTRPRPVLSPNKLFAYGIALMKQAEAEAPPVDVRGDYARGDEAVLRAELFRDGLCIAFLAARPLRLKNMLGLEISVNFLSAASGYAVDLTGAETKTHAPLAFPVPVRLVPFIRRYLETYRPLLAVGPHGVAAGDTEQANALWLTRSGRRLPGDSFATMISNRTTQHFGVRLTPHRFRHCAATSIAENNPEDFHIIRIILGHTTGATAQKHYIEARNRQAFRKAQDNIIALSDPDTTTHRSRAMHSLNHSIHARTDAVMMRPVAHTSTYAPGPPVNRPINTLGGEAAS